MNMEAMGVLSDTDNMSQQHSQSMMQTNNHSMINMMNMSQMGMNQQNQNYVNLKDQVPSILNALYYQRFFKLNILRPYLDREDMSDFKNADSSMIVYYNF